MLFLQKYMKMKTRFFPAHERGSFDYGWLRTNYSFSFANFYEPALIRFGLLRVLNDDEIQGGTGFGEHPHDNMEIISIPLEGALSHKDSMGFEGIVKTGEIQVMSAGNGITHSEFNASETEWGKFLQIWIFPRARNLQSRYDQMTYQLLSDTTTTLVTPDNQQEEKALWIQQDAWISRSKISGGNSITYKLKKEGNGVFIFLIEGETSINDQLLNRRDAIGISETSDIQIKTKSESDILIIEVPMN